MRRGPEKEGAVGAATRSKRKMERGRGQRRRRRARRERGPGPSRRRRCCRRAQSGRRGPPPGWRGLRRRGAGARARRARPGHGLAARGLGPGPPRSPRRPRCAGAPGGVCRGQSGAGPRLRAGGLGGGERAALRGWPWPSSSARPQRAPPPQDLPSSAGQPSVRPSFSPVFRAPRRPNLHIAHRFGCGGPRGRCESGPVASGCWLAHTIGVLPVGARGCGVAACKRGVVCARSGG